MCSVEIFVILEQFVEGFGSGPVAGSAIVEQFLCLDKTDTPDFAEGDLTGLAQRD